MKQSILSFKLKANASTFSFKDLKKIPENFIIKLFFKVKHQ